MRYAVSVLGRMASLQEREQSSSRQMVSAHVPWIQGFKSKARDSRVGVRIR
jgi:tetrahydromethanopterin S-methyltransferase subunit E